MARRTDLVEHLHVALDAAPPHAVMAVVEVALRQAIGARRVTLLLADYAEVTLQVFDGAGLLRPPRLGRCRSTARRRGGASARSG